MSIITKYFLLVIVTFTISGSVLAQKNWKEITSIEDLCESYPERMENMFDHFNMDYAGLEKVKAANNSGNIVDACKYLLEYYKNGTTAQHNDKLHISISAYGKDLLVDAGRFAYTGEVAKKFRHYARGSSAHNIFLIDSKGQDAGPKHATEPLGKSHIKITDDFDYASNSFDSFIDIDGEAKHIRSLFYVRGEFWVVVDRILTDRPRNINALWHWHPECVVESNKRIVKTNNKRGNLAIIPVSKQKFEIEFIKGKEEPEPQGWYSPEYNKFEPNITSSYNTKINENTTFVWLLLPSKGKMPKIAAEVISENDNEVKIEVKSDKNSWQINIPYSDSKNAKLIKE